MKQCSKCKEYKDSSSFYRDASKKDNLTSYCKVCSKEKRMKRYEERTEEEKESFRNHHKENRSLYKNSFLKRFYGISLDDYNEMREAQLFSCLICKTHEKELARGLFVDHCHSTKKVRGLLCQHCNTLLGMAKDNPLILTDAIEYLARNNKHG